MRVISVHDSQGSPFLLAPKQNRKWLESLNSIFGQPLKLLDYNLARSTKSVVYPRAFESDYQDHQVSSKQSGYYEAAQRPLLN